MENVSPVLVGEPDTIDWSQEGCWFWLHCWASHLLSWWLERRPHTSSFWSSCIGTAYLLFVLEQIWPRKYGEPWSSFYFYLCMCVCSLGDRAVWRLGGGRVTVIDDGLWARIICERSVTNAFPVSSSVELRERVLPLLYVLLCGFFWWGWFQPEIWLSISSSWRHLTLEFA